MTNVHDNTPADYAIQFSSATIYAEDGSLLSAGLEPCTVSVQATRAALRWATERHESVVLDDADGLWVVRPDGEIAEISREAWASDDGLIEEVSR
ncbi:MAG TPA: hypothetical protein ENK57_06430 [Polyangiaceae bacterium]|nr:hypothetical protein [Polyangiaceae bacterium]